MQKGQAPEANLARQAAAFPVAMVVALLLAAPAAAPAALSPGPEITVNTTTAGLQSGLAISPDPDGGFIIAWRGKSEPEGTRPPTTWTTSAAT